MGRLAFSFANTCHAEPHFSGRRMFTVVFWAMRGYVCSVPLSEQAANVSKCHIHALSHMSIEHLENKGINYVTSAEYFRNVRRVEKMGIPSASDQEELNCPFSGNTCLAGNFPVPFFPAYCVAPTAYFVPPPPPPTFANSAPVVAATSSCNEFPCESMVTIAGKSLASKTHMASGMPSSSSK